jgi:hypothetical protein
MHTRTRALGVSINRTYRGLAAVGLQAGIHLYVAEPQQRYLESAAGPPVSDAFECTSTGDPLAAVPAVALALSLVTAFPFSTASATATATCSQWVVAAIAA